MEFSAKEVERLLLTKFLFTRAEGTRHRFYELQLEGLPAVRTHVSHGSHDTVGDYLLKAMATQLHVEKRFLEGMLVCTNSKDSYYRRLREAPNPPFVHVVSAPTRK